MTQHLLPDFTDALETRLSAAAGPADPALTATSAAPRRRLLPRLVGPAVAVSLLAAVLFAAGATDDHHAPAAYGKPPILGAAPVAADRILEQVQQGVSVAMVLGPDAKLTEARPFPAFGGTAYVLTGDKGWCITAPDPAMGDVANANPARTGAVSCARTADVYRYGIALGVGNNVVAALPAGAKKPTLTLADGSKRELEPSDQGVVVAQDVPHGSALSLYGPDGSERQLHLP